MEGLEGGRYRLVRTIATGGMAQVYEAVALGHGGFERRVAIKRVLPQLSNDGAMRRMFFDEARIASWLHHGSIVQVLDYGVVEGNEFIVIEFVDGLDGQQAVDKGLALGQPMPEGVALHVAAEIAHALAYAHDRKDPDGEPMGIVHRDVTPHNILLSWDGDVKLSDFGIALASHRNEKTSTGIVKGKIRYMAPEQAMGRRVTGAADVFGLGATLHALATGDPPGEGTAAAPAPELHPALAADLAALIRECVAGDPEARPPAADVAERAGRMAVARLQRDGRGALREWMAPLKRPSARKSTLDDVMGLVLVPAGEGREFSIARVPPSARTSQSGAKSVTPSVVGEAAVATAPLAAPRRLRTWALFAGLAAAIGGGAFVVGRRLAQPEGTAKAVEPAVPLAQPAPQPPPPAPEPPVEPPPPAPAQVRITLRLSPPNARVELDGVVVTENPLVLEKSPAPRKLVVSAPGHAPVTRELVADADRELEIGLVRPPRTPRPKRDRDLFDDEWK